MPRFLYAVVHAACKAPEVRGLEGAEVELCVRDRLGVLWSRVGSGAIRPRRAHVNAHDRVLRIAMASGPLIPLRFGSTVPDEQDAALAVLEGCDADALLERLNVLEGQVQVMLSYEPAESAGVHRVVQRHPQVRDASRSAIDRGREVAAAMQELAIEDLSRIGSSLAQRATAFGEVEQRGGAARVALLVAASSLEAFLAEAEALATAVAPAGRLRAVGGLPPYSFSALDGASRAG